MVRKWQGRVLWLASELDCNLAQIVSLHEGAVFRQSTPLFLFLSANIPKPSLSRNLENLRLHIF